jgi:hypothetical protein
MRQDVAGFGGTARIQSFAAFINVLDDSVLIDDEGGAIPKPLIFVKDPVVLYDCPFEIT